MTPITTLSISFAAFRGLAAAAVLLGGAAASTSEANAFSSGVKVACASDYFSYCSKHALNSPGLRGCMRAAGPQLSHRCIKALVAAGEVSQSEVERRAASLR